MPAFISAEFEFLVWGHAGTEPGEDWELDYEVTRSDYCKDQAVFDAEVVPLLFGA